METEVFPNVWIIPQPMGTEYSNSCQTISSCEATICTKCFTLCGIWMCPSLDTHSSEYNKKPSNISLQSSHCHYPILTHTGLQPKKSVCFNTYIWRPCDSGWRLNATAGVPKPNNNMATWKVAVAKGAILLGYRTTMLWNATSLLRCGKLKGARVWI